MLDNVGYMSPLLRPNDNNMLGIHSQSLTYSEEIAK